MPESSSHLRVALAAWEIGRVGSGFGAKAGGLGQVVEELPPELVKAAHKQGVNLEVVTLSPCFAQYDRSRLKRLDMPLPVHLMGHTFNFEAYEHTFEDMVAFHDGARKVAFKSVYFWDDWQLNWTSAHALYPTDPQLGLRLFSAVSQAMAGYIRQQDFQTVHIHDYHVGLIPFFFNDELLERLPIHFTIHNATYQGMTKLVGGGYNSLNRIGMDGARLFHRYFDHFDQINLTKACMLKVHENGGRITTVSGDLEGTWGYAWELRQCHQQLWQRACVLRGRPPGEVFVPNRYLDLFERIPVAGITNGLSGNNRAENVPLLKAAVLRGVQAKRGQPLFNNPYVQEQMLQRDHTFDVNHLEMKQELRSLLYAECFGHPLWGQPVLFTAVGRLVEQKAFGLVADIIDRVMHHDPQAKFIILASADSGDTVGKHLERRFQHLAHCNPGRVYYNNTFNPALSKLIMAGGDFMLIPSRFEPCGLVDFEASLLGNVPIAHAIGGLTKSGHCGYLYEWLDIRDHWGEADALFWKIKDALYNFRDNHAHHDCLLRRGMEQDATWDRAAAQYLDLYRYGLLYKDWRRMRRQSLWDFARGANTSQPEFRRYFAPAHAPYDDAYDWELKHVFEALGNP
jgi:glycogen synthase